MKLDRRGLLAAGAALPFLYGGKARAANGALTFGLSSYPPSLAPWLNVGTAATTVKFAINRGLLGYSTDGVLRGELAESWERTDPTTWVFKLRDAVFHDGSPVTSEDVRYCIEQVTAPGSTAWFRGEFAQFERIETPDPRTVRIVTKKPLVPVAFWLASCYMMIVKKDSVTEERPHGIGAGPFTLVSQERGVAVEVEAFDRFYRKDEPKLQTIRFVAYADENLRVAALDAGDVDIIEFVPWQSMTSIEQNPRLRLDNRDGGLFMYLFFNGNVKPFDDPRVRVAIAHSIRREEIIQSAFYGRGEVLEGLPIPSTSEFYDPAKAHALAYDPDKARQLLSAAGVGDGFSCKFLSTAQYGMHRDTAIVVQQHLSEVGIQCELVLPDWPTRVAMGEKGQFEMTMNGTTLDYNDPDALGQCLDPALPPSVIRSRDVEVPGLSELLAQGRSEFELAKRKQIYAKVEDLTLEYAPIVALMWRVQGYGMQKKVGGFKNMPGALTIYSGTALSETFV